MLQPAVIQEVARVGLAVLGMVVAFIAGKSIERFEHHRELLEQTEIWSAEYDKLAVELDEKSRQAAERLVETRTIVERVEVPVSVATNDECRIDYAAVEWLRDAANLGGSAEAGPRPATLGALPGIIADDFDLRNSVVFVDGSRAGGNVAEPVQ